MSIIDSMYDQFYEHLGTCVLCKTKTGAIDPDPTCEQGMRMQAALLEMSSDDSDV